MLGVLASLREGRTNEAIRKLESMVDSDLNLLSISLSLGDQLPVLRIEPRARDLDVLRDAQAYRLKYAVKSESTNTEAGVQRIFSLLEKK
jgi:hypothetical protein